MPSGEAPLCCGTSCCGLIHSQSRRDKIGRRVEVSAVYCPPGPVGPGYAVGNILSADKAVRHCWNRGIITFGFTALKCF